MNDDSTKKPQDFTVVISVDQTPEQVFQAITNVRGWWSGEIDGPTDQLGGEFTYRYQNLHYSKQRVTDLVPGKRVEWLVLDSHLSFVEDKREWNGTRMIFEIATKGDKTKGGKTEVRFTHAGLVPTGECYGACSSAWSGYIRDSLRSLITTGKGQPNPRETNRTQVNGPAPARA